MSVAFNKVVNTSYQVSIPMNEISDSLMGVQIRRLSNSSSSSFEETEIHLNMDAQPTIEEGDLQFTHSDRIHNEQVDRSQRQLLEEATSGGSDITNPDNAPDPFDMAEQGSIDHSPESQEALNQETKAIASHQENWAYRHRYKIMAAVGATLGASAVIGGIVGAVSKPQSKLADGEASDKPSQNLNDSSHPTATPNPSTVSQQTSPVSGCDVEVEGKTVRSNKVYDSDCKFIRLSECAGAITGQVDANLKEKYSLIPKSTCSTLNLNPTRVKFGECHIKESKFIEWAKNQARSGETKSTSMPVQHCVGDKLPLLARDVTRKSNYGLTGSKDTITGTPRQLYDRVYDAQYKAKHDRSGYEVRFYNKAPTNPAWVYGKFYCPTDPYTNSCVNTKECYDFKSHYINAWKSRRFVFQVPSNWCRVEWKFYIGGGEYTTSTKYRNNGVNNRICYHGWHNLGARGAEQDWSKYACTSINSYYDSTYFDQTYNT